MVLLSLKFMISEMTLILIKLPFLDDDGPRSTYYGVYSSQLIRFAHVDDFNTRNNNVLTAKRLKQGYRYHNF